MKLASAAQMKELDRQAIEERGIPSIELMERAASGIAETVAGLLPRRSGKCRVAVLCGAGNNGGDGIAAAGCCICGASGCGRFWRGTTKS